MRDSSYLCERGEECESPYGASAGFRDRVLSLKLGDGYVCCCVLSAFLWVLK